MSKKTPKYPPEFKKEICELAKNTTIIKAAVTYKVSRKTLCKWLRVYNSGSFEALSERKKRFRVRFDYRPRDKSDNYGDKVRDNTPSILVE